MIEIVSNGLWRLPKIKDDTLEFVKVINLIEAFLEPIYKNIVIGSEYKMKWNSRQWV